MNKSERMMAGRMTFTARRGRTAEYLRDEWLRNLRRERQPEADGFVVNVGGSFFRTADTLRRAKIAANGCSCELRKITGRNPKIWIYDRWTMIVVWNN